MDKNDIKAALRDKIEKKYEKSLRCWSCAAGGLYGIRIKYSWRSFVWAGSLPELEYLVLFDNESVATVDHDKNTKVYSYEEDFLSEIYEACDEMHKNYMRKDRINDLIVILIIALAVLTPILPIITMMILSILNS